jgi:hypothetical protein
VRQESPRTFQAKNHKVLSRAARAPRCSHRCHHLALARHSITSPRTESHINRQLEVVQMLHQCRGLRVTNANWKWSRCFTSAGVCASQMRNSAYPFQPSTTSAIASRRSWSFAAQQGPNGLAGCVRDTGFKQRASPSVVDPDMQLGTAIEMVGGKLVPCEILHFNVQGSKPILRETEGLVWRYRFERP